ncbi:MAG TPA: hypothetical protein VFU01_18775 [Gemmatimonadaceae bacterium]|nr:hypothetical protein [Gemmatimonadaceae bacterium]
MRLTPLLLVLVIAPLACSDITGVDDDLRVVTDRASYVTNGDSVATVRVRLENTGTDPLGVPRCGMVTAYLDKWTASDWVQVGRYGEICVAIYDMSPVRLGPGDAHEAPPLAIGVGRYRIRVPFGRAGGDVRAHTARSNVFTVEPSP